MKLLQLSISEVDIELSRSIKHFVIAGPKVPVSFTLDFSVTLILLAGLYISLKFRPRIFKSKDGTKVNTIIITIVGTPTPMTTLSVVERWWLPGEGTAAGEVDGVEIDETGWDDVE